MGTSNKAPLSLDVITQHLAYDIETGRLMWRTANCRRRPGEEAGSSKGNGGYLQVGLLGNVCLAHRIAWAIAHKVWPVPHGIDHINGIRSDNRLTNLRAADQSENMRNRGPSKVSRTGVKGVYNHPHGGYMAQVCHRYQTIYLGYFNNIDDARRAYEMAALRLHDQYRHSPVESQR